MKPFFVLILITSVCLFPLPVMAETLTLNQSQSIAAQQNPDFLAAQKRLGISEAEIVTAGALPNPFFVTDNGIAEKTYRLGVQQTFLLGGDRGKRVALAQAQRDVSLSEINQTLLNLRAEVRQAYTRLYNAQARQEAFQQLLDLSQQLLRVAQKREQAGDIAEVDVLQTQLLALEARNDLRAVEYDLVQARNRFGTLLNQPMDETLQLAPPTLEPTVETTPSPLQEPADPSVLQGSVQKADLDPNTLIELAFSRRPDVQQNLRLQEVTRRQEALAKAKRIPDVTLTAGPDLVFEGNGSYSAFIIGTVEIPILNRQQGPIQEAQARRVQLEQELGAIRNRVALDVRSAYTAYQRNQVLLEQYENDLLPTAQKLAQKARRAFEEGKTSVLFPVNAQQAYVKTRLGYLQILQDYQQAVTDLEKAIGSGL